LPTCTDWVCGPVNVLAMTALLLESEPLNMPVKFRAPYFPEASSRMVRVSP
jgi:hypothetical protein